MNRLFDAGVFPDGLKAAQVVPLHEKNKYVMHQYYE